MQDTLPVVVCRACGASTSENYCGKCGQSLVVKRISFKSLLHDVFHFFTHLDKGIGYTLKKLLVAPGSMQRSYVEGDRSRHQKPFSMFFICATVTALVRYWVYLALVHFQHLTDLGAEADFFHKYLVIIHVVLLPLYALIIYVFFQRSKYNYAEVGVLVLYMMSFIFLISSATSLLRLVWPSFEGDYVDIPLVAIYSAFTFPGFFNDEKKWLAALKGIIAMAVVFVVANYCEDLLRNLLS